MPRTSKEVVHHLMLHDEFVGAPRVGDHDPVIGVPDGGAPTVHTFEVTSRTGLPADAVERTGSIEAFLEFAPPRGIRSWRRVCRCHWGALSLPAGEEQNQQRADSSCASDHGSRRLWAARA